MDDIRKAFATANKVDAGLFSFNSKGACENCKGPGVIYTELSFLDGVKTPCEICEGRRFKDEVLEYKLDGRNVSEVLGLTVAHALEAFTQKEIVRKLQAMSDVGLDYLTLGPAAEHAVGRRVPAHQARERAAQARATSTCSTSRRPGSTCPTRATCWRCSIGSSTPATR